MIRPAERLIVGLHAASARAERSMQFRRRLSPVARERILQ
jgi:hypothetical protein